MITQVTKVLGSNEPVKLAKASLAGVWGGDGLVVWEGGKEWFEPVVVGVKWDPPARCEEWEKKDGVS